MVSVFGAVLVVLRMHSRRSFGRSFVVAVEVHRGYMGGVKKDGEDNRLDEGRF